MSTTAGTPAHDLETGLTAADRRHAALVACGYAGDPAEARELLEALGLLAELRAEVRLAG